MAFRPAVPFWSVYCEQARGISHVRMSTCAKSVSRPTERREGKGDRLLELLERATDSFLLRSRTHASTCGLYTHITYILYIHISLDALLTDKKICKFHSNSIRGTTSGDRTKSSQLPHECAQICAKGMANRTKRRATAYVMTILVPVGTKHGTRGMCFVEGYACSLRH